MKNLLICTILLSTLTMLSCEKQGSPETGAEDAEYIDGYTRVIGLRGNDTSSTKYIRGNGRVQALAFDEDATLSAELIGYQPLSGGQGKYTVKMVNKTNCQRILRWNWQNLAVTSIIPDDLTGGPAKYDVIHSNEIKVYTIIGKSIAGKIFVKAEKSNSECENSRQLIIEITETILPIKYTDFTRTRTGKYVTVQWSTDSPGDVDTFIVLWSPNGKVEDEVSKYIIMSDGKTKKYTATYEAVKKLK